MRLLGALLLLGCGGANFTGVWTGMLTTRLACDDGTMSTNVGPVRATMAQRGDNLDIAFGGSCGAYVADVTGNVAVVRAKSCGALVYTAGRLELVAADRLDMSLQSTNGTTCSALQFGTLDLEK